MDFNITEEMEDWFVKRTKNHIDLVKFYGEKILYLMEDNWGEQLVSEFKKRLVNHDQDKLTEPNRTPYTLITWNYYCKEHNIDFFYHRK